MSAARGSPRTRACRPSYIAARTGRAIRVSQVQPVVVRGTVGVSGAVEVDVRDKQRAKQPRKAQVKQAARSIQPAKEVPAPKRFERGTVQETPDAPKVLRQAQPETQQQKRDDAAPKDAPKDTPKSAPQKQDDTQKQKRDDDRDTPKAKQKRDDAAPKAEPQKRDDTPKQMQKRDDGRAATSSRSAICRKSVTPVRRTSSRNAVRSPNKTRLPRSSARPSVSKVRRRVRSRPEDG